VNHIYYNPLYSEEWVRAHIGEKAKEREERVSHLSRDVCWITVRGLAHRTGFTQNLVRQLIQQGVIKAYRAQSVRGHYYIHPDEAKRVEAARSEIRKQHWARTRGSKKPC
jgi:hypothetical protein